jgi:glycosyltransferase involved in cell wall biosynthesis
MRIGIQAQRIFRTKKNYDDIVALATIKAIQDIDAVNEYFIFTELREENTSFFESPNFKIVELPKQTPILWEQIVLLKEVKKYKLDLLHSISGFPPILLHLKLIITVKNTADVQWRTFKLEQQWNEILYGLYVRVFISSLMLNANKLFVSSRFEMNNINAFLKSDYAKIKLVYNGVSPVFFTELSDKKMNGVREKYALPNKFLLLFGINGEVNTNLYKTLKGYQFYTEIERNPFALVILNLSKEQLLEQIIERGIDPSILSKIRLIGLESEAELPYIYKLSSVFLNTLSTDRIEIPMIEAMASGIPVISSDTKIMSEIAGGAALLSDSDNAADLAIKISRVTKTASLRRDMIFKGNARALKFTLKEMAERILNTYYELTLGKPNSLTDFKTDKFI